MVCKLYGFFFFLKSLFIMLNIGGLLYFYCIFLVFLLFKIDWYLFVVNFRDERLFFRGVFVEEVIFVILCKSL